MKFSNAYSLVLTKKRSALAPPILMQFGSRNHAQQTRVAQGALFLAFQLHFPLFVWLNEEEGVKAVAGTRLLLC
jgi:hypothetical protein